MTTQTNSFRLHRLINNIDIKKKSISTLESHGSQTLQIAALNSINKSVKYGNTSFTMGLDLSKLRKEPNQPANIQEECAHFNLLSVRKKYDCVNKSRLQREKLIGKLEEEKEKFSGRQSQFIENKNEEEDKNRLENELSQIKTRLQETQTQRKVLLNVIDRMKSDQIVFTHKENQKEKELQSIFKGIKIIEKQRKAMGEEQDRSKKVQGKLFREISEQQNEREVHVQSLQGMKSQRASVVEHNQVREKFIVEIAENALQQKDNNQKKWHKVYLCHRLVEKLLRDKMSKEMMKFNVVETAFKNIKTSTGVTNTQTLVNKFMNKQNTYGEHLSKIAENEKMMAELKAENDQLNKERKSLLEDEETLNSNKDQNQDLGRQLKNFKQISQKRERFDLYEKRIKEWLSRNIRKFSKMGAQLQKQQEHSNNINNATAIIQSFKKYLKILSLTFDQETQVLQSKQTSQVVQNSKNCRLKFIKKNLDEVDLLVFHQEQIANTMDDDDVMNDQRNQILKSNDKFMKELQKKTEELKKAKLQLLEPKKKVVVKPVELVDNQ